MQVHHVKHVVSCHTSSSPLITPYPAPTPSPTACCSQCIAHVLQCLKDMSAHPLLPHNIVTCPDGVQRPVAPQILNLVVDEVESRPLTSTYAGNK